MYVPATKSMYSFLYDIDAPINNRSYVVYSFDLAANRGYKSRLIFNNMSFNDFSGYSTVADGAAGPNGNLGYFLFDTGSFYVAGFSCTSDRSYCRITPMLFALDAPPQSYTRHPEIVFDPIARELYVAFKQRGDDKWELRVYNVEQKKAVRRFPVQVKGGSLYSMVMCKS